MRATRNWGLIRTGETFEALVTTVIFFEDASASLLGRRGCDGGQDARSGDGQTVYQAKHQVRPTAANAIAAAKREASNIERYRQVGHARRGQWAGVTNWVLVTNASFNPTDDHTWKNEVEPTFSTLGLKATYWEEATLDGYLDKHPEIDRAFFQNENRVFLSAPEARLRVAEDDPFTQREDLAPYVGRVSDLAALDAFLVGSKRYLQVHAAGGIGKTRFLLEGACEIAAKGDWQVLWANVHSMEASSAWFDAVVPERPTLLIVDEPDDDRLVQRLQEQLGGRVGRAQQWKIAVAVRSAKDPIVRALQDPRRKRWVEELLLKPLETQECEAMCLKLLETGKLAHADQTWREATARTLACRFDGYPIWLSLAVHLLEEKGSLATLPETASELCRFYLDEALKAGPAGDGLLQLVRWIALLGPVNREDESQIEHLKDRCGFAGAREVQDALRRLVLARLLRKWGARDRLVDVKPDVLRDFILRDWFCEERDYGACRYVPSEAAQELTGELSKSLEDGTAGMRGERVLAALARTDFLLRYGDAPANLGAPLFAALNSALPDMSPLKRIAVVEKLAGVGAYYPEETLHLLRRLRLEEAAEETVAGCWGTHTYSQKDVVLALAHAYHRVALGLLNDDQSTMLLGELCALVIEEGRIGPMLEHGLPNDGKRADGIIQRLLENGPSYCREFGDAATEVVLRDLNAQSLGALGSDRLKAVHAVAKPLCNVQRYQIWSDGPKMRLRTQLLLSTHSNMEGAERVLARIRALLESEVDAIDDEGKAALWDIVSEAHRGANYAKGELVDEDSVALSELNKRLRDDLDWVEKVFAQRTPSPRELRAARKIWHWHAEFEKDKDIGVLAAQLENVYLSHPTVELFESLTHRGAREDTQRRVEHKASELAVAGTAEMAGFLMLATEYLGEQEVPRVFSVASALGQIATEHESVRTFLTEGLQTYRRKSCAYQFVMNGLYSWVFSVRRQNPARAAELVGKLLGECSVDTKLDILTALYRAPIRHDEALRESCPECELVRKQKAVFVEANAISDFIVCTLWGFRHDWAGLKTCIEDALDAADRKRRADAMRALVKQAQQVVDTDGDSTLPTDFLEWFWRQVVATGDLYCLGQGNQWYLEQVLKALGRVPTAWLVDAVRRRAAMHKQAGDLGFDAPSKLVRLVELIGTDNASAPDIKDTVGKLVGMFPESPLMEHWLPKLLVRLDPQGLEVPRRLVNAINGAVTPAEVSKLSRAACYYKVGTPAWRQIARAAFNASVHFPTADRENVFYSVSDTGRRFRIRNAAEVPRDLTDAVESAKRSLAEENEPDFVPFWQWHLRRAEHELGHEEERLKEEVWA